MSKNDADSSHVDTPASEVSVDEVEKALPGQWILMKVTDSDDRGNPTKGIVLANHSGRSRVSAELANIDAGSTNGRTGPFYVFHAPPHSGVKMAKRVLGVSLSADEDAADAKP